MCGGMNDQVGCGRWHRRSEPKWGEVSVHTGVGIWLGLTRPEQVRRASTEGMPLYGQPKCREDVHAKTGPAGVSEPAQVTRAPCWQ